MQHYQVAVQRLVHRPSQLSDRASVSTFSFSHDNTFIYFVLFYLWRTQLVSHNASTQPVQGPAAHSVVVQEARHTVRHQTARQSVLRHSAVCDSSIL